jgi:hypothetical protein
MCKKTNLISLTDVYYKSGGPLFFYCGNEGDIEMFWNNTGFQFELAQEFSKSFDLYFFLSHFALQNVTMIIDTLLSNFRVILDALVVFAEHRFYGKTMPLGEHSMTVEGLSYCTVEQALADYAKLITWLKY